MEVPKTMFRVLLSLAAFALTSTVVRAEDKAPVIRTLSRSGAALNLVVEISFRVRIDRPLAGHDYRFMYQYRVHTKKGELGEILGDATLPNGKAFELGPLVKPVGAGWEYDTPSAPPVTKEGLAEVAKGLEFDGRVDVTRKELSGMTNLPKGAATVILRVEPHVYDMTDKKFLTPGKTRAVLLFLTLSKTGRVESLQPFEDWFPLQFDTEDKARAAVRVVDDDEAWDNHDALQRGFRQVLESPKVKPALKALAVRALPKWQVHLKSGFPALLETLARSENAELKAAAEAKLAEAKK